MSLGKGILVWIKQNKKVKPLVVVVQKTTSGYTLHLHVCLISPIRFTIHALSQNYCGRISVDLIVSLTRSNKALIFSRC